MSLIKRILWYFKPLKTTVANISITAPSRKLAASPFVSLKRIERTAQ